MKILALAVTISFVLSVALLSQQRSTAEAWCDPGRSDDGITYEAGWGRNPGLDVGGVYSKIWNYPTPYVEVGRRTIQVVTVEKTGTNLYAALGWRQDNGGASRVTWAEWRLSPGVAVAGFGYTPQPQNNFSYYKLTHNRQNPGQMKFEIGPTLSNLTNITTVNDVLWVPNRGETQGRTTSLGNQMPGGYQTPSIFGDTKIWYSGAWSAFNGAVFITNPSYHYAFKQSDLQLDIQDWACP